MLIKQKIRVLIVDDSLLFREIIAKGISSDNEIEVVATANDPFDARDKIIKYKPDVMTCDIEMPKMNGVEFIKRLLPQYPIPVIIVSMVDEAVFDAVNAGAVDFVSKPDPRLVRDVESFIYEMITKVKIASLSKVILQSSQPAHINSYSPDNINKNRLIAIGASTGGTEAIYRLLKKLPEDMPGIVIVQHIPPVFSRMFAERLNDTTAFEVKEACTGDYLDKGKVLIAPGDQHMRIRKIGDRYKVECFNGERVNGHCPSVDVLFDSVAKMAGSNAVGIILTGMGYDGAKGLLAMKRMGARTIGQDEKSAIVYGMPKVAYNIGAVEQQASIDDIPYLLLAMLR